MKPWDRMAMDGLRGMADAQRGKRMLEAHEKKHGPLQRGGEGAGHHTQVPGRENVSPMHAPGQRTMGEPPQDGSAVGTETDADFFGSPELEALIAELKARKG